MCDASKWHRGILAGVAVVTALAGTTEPAFAKGTKGQTPVAEAYEAQFGDWTVSCDPCASYEDSVCLLWTNPDIGEIWIFPIDEQDPKSPLAMSYFPERNLAIGTEGTLTVSVDGSELLAISPPDVAYLEMYGDLFVEAAVATPLLPHLSAGATLTLEYVDADGGAPETFDLEGFGSALADLQQHLPFPRRPFDDSQPDSCQY